ncbi:hypothetical protein [Sigmofec virus UA08Rod_5692]|uniref:Uncharacterized protein n=1 Tax=Sigmofec virus UA08Rod_5692 TaxID=2929436 RepID=A0A976R7B2_9VIRU|nr:hypothetical protein [Sigmofec virus UA08Rod_5692]
MSMSTKSYSLCIDGVSVVTGSSRKINDIYSVCMVLMDSYVVSDPVKIPVVTVVVNM